MAEPPVLWRPTPDDIARSRLGAFLRFLDRRGRAFAGYDDLWAWSVEDPAGFWDALAEHFGVEWTDAPRAVLSGPEMPGARWFDGGTLNYAYHALRDNGRGAGDVAVVAHSQSRPPVEMTVAELRTAVDRAAAGLRRLGVTRGDRVAAYLPNIPETLVAFLASASIGAVWSSCAPEFGTRSVIDRFGQIEPVVLLAVDGYRYGAKAIDRAREAGEIRAALPSLRAVVHVPYLDPDALPPVGAVSWADLLAVSDTAPNGAGAGMSGAPDGAGARASGWESVPFDHPLYILYSSGTTGLPKAIVHGHGGITLEHLKMLALHNDLGPGDRFFWFSTTGWMMWNYLVSGLLVGATLVLFDGDPGYPDLDTLWDLAARTRISFLGVSAPFLMACRKADLEPARDHALGALRGIGSTGAPLPAEGFRWVYQHAASRPDLLLASISGGTDVCTAFVGMSPGRPVWEGEISCRCLGARVEAFDAYGQPLIGEEGELVITAPMPSMPVALWNDPTGEHYHDAYFGVYPGVWRHGDWLTITERGSCVISGRSDATLNRGGVRLGTAELYAVVESMDEVADSLAVHLEGTDARPNGRLLLFVVPVPGVDVDDALRARIAAALRIQLSPRHVPDEIVAVEAVPRTLSGKKLEVPVKRILSGADPDSVAARGALADPKALDLFARFARGSAL